MSSIKDVRLGIIIPAYNEEKRIRRTLIEYCEFYSTLKNKKEIKDVKVLVVLNNCSDNTLEIVKKSQKEFSNLDYLDLTLGGKGYAIMEGFKEFLSKYKGDNILIGFVDADMATPPKEFYKLVKNIGYYDGIIASRYVTGSIVDPKQSFQRILASRIFNFLIRTLFLMHYKDTQCGAKLFKRKLIEKITPELKITKWAFDVNLLYLCKKTGAKVKEDATMWQDKEYSKINLKKAGTQMFFSLIRLRIVYSPFKSLIKIYDKMPSWIKIKI